MKYIKLSGKNNETRVRTCKSLFPSHLNKNPGLGVGVRKEVGGADHPQGFSFVPTPSTKYIKLSGKNNETRVRTSKSLFPSHPNKKPGLGMGVGVRWGGSDHPQGFSFVPTPSMKYIKLSGKNNETRVRTCKSLFPSHLNKKPGLGVGVGVRKGGGVRIIPRAFPL